MHDVSNVGGVVGIGRLRVLRVRLYTVLRVHGLRRLLNQELVLGRIDSVYLLFRIHRPRGEDLVIDG